MKLTDEMFERVNECMEDLYREYDYIGVRVQDEEFAAGAIEHVSHIWVDGVDTGEEIGGICAVGAHVGADMLRQLVETYDGKHVAIIGSNSMEYGEDQGEIILYNAFVIEVLA